MEAWWPLRSICCLSAGTAEAKMSMRGVRRFNSWAQFLVVAIIAFWLIFGHRIISCVWMPLRTKITLDFENQKLGLEARAPLDCQGLFFQKARKRHTTIIGPMLLRSRRAQGLCAKGGSK